MKPLRSGNPPTEEHIRAAFAAGGIPSTPEQVRLLAAHAAAVLAANEITNLTRITESADFVRLHIVDSLIPLRYANLAEGAVIDVGSGAGFPGLPLAIAGCSVTLCEARKKKADYLELWTRDLGLRAAVLPLRAEEIAPSGHAYDWAVMRAVSSLASLLELASPLLRPGGRLLAMKGLRSSEEEERAARVSRIVGMKLERVEEYVLPGGTEQRTLYIYVRKGQVGLKLPRRPGLAQTQPLG